MTASSTTAKSPLQAVLAAVGSGVTTRAELLRSVNLPDDVVDAALDHLIRTGRVGSQPLTLGCATADCGGCPLAIRKRCQSR